MQTPWAARLGLVSMSVLALAACNRNQPAGSAAGSDATGVPAAASDMAHDLARGRKRRQHGLGLVMGAGGGGE